MTESSYQKQTSASLVKQFAAMLYDSILIFAVLLLGFGVLLLLNAGNPIESVILRRIYLLLIWSSYYAWFWQKSGQTLGMRVWKIRLVTDSGVNPGWTVCYLRLSVALVSFAFCGLGYAWRLFKPYTWHDKLSATRVIHVSSSASTT